MHTHFMRMAIDLSMENVEEGNGGPFGAVIVRDGKILATGTNLVTATNDPVAHAEIVAIRFACRQLGDFRLKGCILYTSCEPCPMCLGAIYWARLNEVYFACNREDAARAGFDDSLIYEELGQAPALRRIPMRNLMKEEAEKVFDAWLGKADRIEY